MKKILLIIAIISLFSFNNMKGQLLTEDFSLSSLSATKFATTTGSRSSGTSYTCAVGNYVRLITSSGYLRTVGIPVPQNYGMEIKFKLKVSGSPNVDVYIRTNGIGNFSTLAGQQHYNSWIKIGDATTYACGWNTFTVPAPIVGGQLVSVLIYFQSAGTWTAIDDLTISAVSYTAAPTVPYTQSFTSDKFYPTVGYVPIPFRSYYEAGGTFGNSITLSNFGAGGSGDYYMSTLGTNNASHFITQEINTSGCPVNTGQLRYKFKGRHPAGSGTYTSTTNEDYSTVSGSETPKVYIKSGAHTSSTDLSYTQLPVNNYFSDNTWHYSSYDISNFRTANVKFKFETYSANTMNIDDIKVFCRDCRISTQTPLAISGPATTSFEPNVNYNFSIPKVTYGAGGADTAKYYLWMVRRVDLGVGQHTIYYGTTPGANPYIVSGQGTRYPVINFGTSANYYRVLCLPFDEVVTSPNSNPDACHAKIAYFSQTCMAERPDATAATSVADVSFTANWNAVTGATKYYIDVANDINFSSILGSYNNKDVGNVISTSVTGLTSGNTYYYRVRALVGCTSNHSDTISVTTVAACTAPTLTARANGTATSTTICNGDEVDLTSNPSGGADCSGTWDYEWSTTDATQDVNDLTPAANVTYRVTVSCSDDAACSNTSQVIVAVNDVPTISTQPIDTTICDGQNTRFIMATSGATSHKWQVDDGGGFVDIANGGVYSNATTTTLNITGAGTAMSSYLYRGVATNGCGSVNTSSRELTVNAVPAAPAGDDKSICEGGVVPDLEATGTAIEWYSDAGLTTNVESGVTFATGETDPGTYTFYATQTIDGCESPANTIELEIVAKPAAPTGTDDVACTPATEVTVEATSGLDTIKWYDDPTAGSLLHTGGTYTDNIVATTSYYADATNAEGCVSDRTEVQGIITTTDTTTLMSASGISETEFTALWHSKPLALNYWLDVSTDSTFSTFLAGYNNRDMDLDTTITISGLTPGVRYHYRVRVENVCGLGINIANVISVSTPLTPCRTYRKCIWEGDVSTDWNTAANWKCDSIPTAYDTVLIPTLPANFNPVIGVAPNPTTDGICNNITIETGEVLTINTGRELVVKGDWTNNGSAELGEGEVVFSKGSTQYIRGANNWANIEFANDVIMVAATGAQNLKGVMKKTAGTLTTNNQLTLLSVSTPAPYGRTACIDGGIGSVAGDVTVQRYLFPPGGTNIGYKYLSVPTSNATVAQFSSDDITVKSTYWNADYSQLKWSNFWYYNEVNTAQVLHPDPVITDINQQIMQNGWIAPSGPADPMPPMRGYALYIDCNKAIDVVGPLNDGEQTFTLSYTNSTVVGAPTATSNHDGWNFIGNPYPCPIDYSVEAGWDKTNVLPPVYFFKPTTLYYGVDYMWVPIGGGYGVSIPEGLSPVIGSMQSFFVKTENEAKHGSTFTVNNLARTPVTDANCYKKSNAIYPYQLRLQIENRITKRDDQTLIYFAKGATIGYDPKMEAFKMISEDPDMPFIYSKVINNSTNETHYLAINALPYPKEDIEIPLTIALREANTYIIKPMQMPAFVAGETVWLEDRIDGKMQNLSENPAYIINLPKGTHSNRFFIHIKKATKPCINPETQFVTNIQGSTVRLNWSSVETAEQYLIRWRAKTPGVPWRYYNATPSQNAVTIGHLAPQSTYEWQMRTLCFGELSYATTFTELQEFKTKVDCKDIVVRGRQVTDITTSKAVIKYYTEPLATHYMIRFREKNTADWKYLNVAGDVGAVQIGCEVCDPIHKLKTATTYEWQMRAFCKVDNSVYSAFSTILEFTTLDNKKKYNPENSIINKVADNVTLNVFPNPYKGETNIKYTLQTKAKIKIEVYNMFGVIVAVIEDKILEAGAYNAKFSAKDIGLSAGIYTIKLQTPDYTVERKIVEIE